MKQRIFMNTFMVTLLVFVASMVITVVGIYKYYDEQKTKEFRAEAQYLCAVLEKGGEESLTAVGQLKANEKVFRVTLIAADGTVRYDSTVEVGTLANHGDREEFKEALQKGVGESTRYSDTLAQKTYNYAIRTAHGEVLRVSGEQSTGINLLLRLIYPMVIVLAIVLVLSFVVAERISRSIMEPINAIDLERLSERAIYPELRPLVQRINAQNRQLHRQMTELQEEHEKQDRMRREFTANVLHELKTPLTSISGYAEILGAGMVQEQDIPKFAGRIYDEAQRLIVLVGDIIKLSQLDEREIEIQKTDIDLYRMSEDILSRLEHTAQRKQVRLQLEGTNETVHGVREIVEEMVYNLVDNAVKYNRENGAVTVSVRCDDTSGEVFLTVKDTGIGIPREDLPRIFERFYRVDKSHSKELGGTGLGLSIVKHGALYHGATIAIDSALGEGTEITIRFPKAQ